MLNRTIFSDEATATGLRNEGPKAELHDKKLTLPQREAIRKLMEVHGLTHLYPEDVFYNTHKISRADFLQKLESLESAE